jgi:hypothetical protein
MLRTLAVTGALLLFLLVCNLRSSTLEVQVAAPLPSTPASHGRLPNRPQSPERTRPAAAESPSARRRAGRLRLRLSTEQPGSFDVVVDGHAWLTAGLPTQLRHDQRPLQLLGQGPTTRSGEDALGKYARTEWQWGAGGRPALETAVRAYEHALVFEQAFRAPRSSRTPADGSLCSRFPSFGLPSRAAAHAVPGGPLHYLAYDGDMAGQLYRAGPWHDAARAAIGSGLAGTAPLVLFSSSLNTSLVLSPFSEFFVGTQQYEWRRGAGASLSYGVPCSYTPIPAGFRLETVLLLSRGVGEAMISWGDVLLARYGKRREAAWAADPTLTTLGYGTQNGAYYYYNAPRGTTYEAVLLAAVDDARSRSIPYKWWLADSWWYEKHAGVLPRGVPRPGVTRWEATAEAFPRGLGYVAAATGLALMAHNRYWSAFTPYAAVNGGEHDFVVDKGSGFALPVGRAFWDGLWARARRRGWGLVTYEQDWMNFQTERLAALTTNVSLGRSWLLQMGTSAAEANVSIQYCMSLCRHILSSVEVGAVTQARGSGDYRAGNDLWSRLGLTSLLLYALGLGASKDTFWTAPSQPGNRWGDSTVEPYPGLQAAVATLTRGPVAPSDAIGLTDRELLMRSATEGGVLLQPAMPATAIDAAVLALARGRPMGEVWFAPTTVSGRRYGTLFVARVRRKLALRGADLGYRGEDGAEAPALLSMDVRAGCGARVGQSRAAACAVAEGVPAVVPCGLSDFHIWSIAPIEAGEWTLLGELGKWVAVSPARVKSILAHPDHPPDRPLSGGRGAKRGLEVRIEGARGERVLLAFARRAGGGGYRAPAAASEEGEDTGYASYDSPQVTAIGTVAAESLEVVTVVCHIPALGCGSVAQMRARVPEMACEEAPPVHPPSGC